jgi:hypothetical protein
VTERGVQRLARHWRIAPARVAAEYNSLEAFKRELGFSR